MQNLTMSASFSAVPKPFKTANNISNNHSNGLLNLNTNLSLTNTILIAKFDYESKESHELSLKKNERLILIDNSKNWWLVKKQDTNQTGYVPSNFVKKEKKSIFDKIIPRMLQAASNNNNNNINNINSNNNNNKSVGNEEINSNSKTNTHSSNLASISRALVKHKYNALKPDELTLNAGMKVRVLEKFGDGWWKVAVLLDDQNKESIGLYPSNYLQEESNTSNSISKSLTNSIRLLKSEKLNNNLLEANNNNNNNPTKSESISSSDRDFDYVKVIHAYKSNKKNETKVELTVDVNEILKVIEDDEELLDYDKSWIKVFNSQGITGFIPSNCVEPILDHQLKNFVFIRRPTTIGLFANNSWYFGNISRFDAIILLNRYAVNGDYLVRDSDNGNFSISLKSDHYNNKHFKVLFKENRFTIGKKLFNKMEELLLHYQINPIYDQNNEKLFLVKPFRPPPSSEIN